MRRAFSFTEILFAVMILGIGFIMVAAMFPVAIQQTQATGQESVAASIGRAGVDYMQQLASMRVLVTAGPPNNPLINSGVVNSSVATSILLPTLDPSSLSNTPSTYPPGTIFPVRIPGQVWSLHETTQRDPYQVIVAGALQRRNHADVLWQAASHNLIFPADPRYGMAIMYKRDLIGKLVTSSIGVTSVSYSPAPDAQIIVIALQARSRAAYRPYSATANDPCDVAHYVAGYPATLEPLLVNAAGGTVQITRQGTASFLRVRDPLAAGRIAEGTYFVLAQDGQAGNPPGGPGGQYVAHIYQVGAQQAVDQWLLAPGNDLGTFPSDPLNGFSNGRGPQILLVGRGYTDPANPVNGGFSGGAQDVGVFTGFIPVN